MSDFGELEAYKKTLENFSKVNVSDLLSYVTRQISARFLERVVAYTPVEENAKFKYIAPGGTVAEGAVDGGALRRAWVGGKDTEGMDYSRYASTLPVVRQGKEYELTITNDKEYASFVESGHKQRPGRFVRYIGPEVDGVRQGAYLKHAKVDGIHMMKMSATEIGSMAPGLSEKLINEYFRKHPIK